MCSTRATCLLDKDLLVSTCAGCGMNAMDSTYESHPKFLDLPLELRLQIYTSIWPPSTTLTWDSPPVTSKKLRREGLSASSQNRNVLAFLQVNRALRHDALPIFHLYAIFRFSNAPTFRKFLNTFPPASSAQIQHILLDIPVDRFGRGESGSEIARTWRLPQLFAATTALRSLRIVQHRGVPGVLYHQVYGSARLEELGLRIGRNAMFWMRDVHSLPFKITVQVVEPRILSISIGLHASFLLTWMFEVDGMGPWEEELKDGKVRSRWKVFEGFEESKVEKAESNRRGRVALGPDERRDEWEILTERKRNRTEIVAWRMRAPTHVDLSLDWKMPGPDSDDTSTLANASQ